MKFGAERIVCLTEETTEALYLMGEQDRIVGISAFTCRPPEAKRDKPIVSQFVKAKIDKILDLKPDLVLGFSDLQADICKELISHGLDVYCFNQRSIEGIFAMFYTLSALIGEVKKGEELIERFQNEIREIQKTSSQFKIRPRVYFEEWHDPIITGIRWVSELIEIAGGVDCFPEMRNRKLAKERIVNSDEILQRKPDLMLASWCGKVFREKKVKERPGFLEADFVALGRMVEIPSSIILQPGPACLSDGLKKVHFHIKEVSEKLN